MQRIEKFFADGTMGAKGGKNTLESVVLQMNNDGWRVDQVVPLSFRPNKYSEGTDVVYGILLCSKADSFVKNLV